jgi:hypothetical protein
MVTKNNALNGSFLGTGGNIPTTTVQAGNPNTVVAGASFAAQQGDLYFDSTAGIGYTATTGGASGTAVWTADSSSTSAFTWANTTTTTQAMAANTGYISNNAALSTFTLPAVAAVGNRVAVQGAGAGGFTIAQNAAQTIHFGTSVTTAGTGGSIASTNQFDHLEMICITANTTWAAYAAQGNLTVT